MDLATHLGGCAVSYNQTYARGREPLKNSGSVSIDSGNHRERVRARRDELVREHLSLAAGIARAIARGLPPCFDLDDLVGIGNVALVHAATSFRPETGVPFAAWARLRVRGAILDATRRGKYEEATRPGLEAAGTDDPGSWVTPATDARIDAARLRRDLGEAISWLPPAQQRVLYGYYSPSAPTQQEVALEMGVSLSTLHKLHAAAVEGLRRRFRRVGFKRAA